MRSCDSAQEFKLENINEYLSESLTYYIFCLFILIISAGSQPEIHITIKGEKLAVRSFADQMSLIDPIREIQSECSSQMNSVGKIWIIWMSLIFSPFLRHIEPSFPRENSKAISSTFCSSIHTVFHSAGIYLIVGGAALVYFVQTHHSSVKNALNLLSLHVAEPF